MLVINLATENIMFGIWLVPLLIVGVLIAVGFYFVFTVGLAHVVPIVENAIGATALHWLIGVVLVALLAFAIVVNKDS
ncbi:hypothetical protein [Paraburkholderia fungorum]|uniref:Uncharacterized protein n=1 Tax=Paraburkholderia fungorum TaxID=134537 RepID=A0AAW3V4F4_9BURK|nr:hypothetical protein [Paraburkholderia fungorum]MBB4517197.1 hypothetical protein [Paraburkholderia fungorum]MBB6204265.1 hypothetical protein [Paraburkholderia fungorum]